MKKKTVLKFFIWPLAGIITLVALLYAWIDWHGARVWQKTEAALRAKGEPMRPEEIIPPPIPDEQNFAFSPFFKGVFEEENGHPKYPEAIQRLNALALPQEPAPPRGASLKNADPVDLAAWQKYFHAHPEFRLPAAEGDPVAEVLLALAHWKAPLDELARDLRERPLMRAPLHYERGFEIALPHLNSLLQVSKFYQLRAVAEIHQGHAAGALADLESILLLRRAAEPRQNLIGCLVASSIESQALAVLREGIAAHIWNDPQLSGVSEELSRIQPLQEMAGALRAERVFFLDATRRITPSQLSLMTQLNTSNTSPQTPGGMVIWSLFQLPRGGWDLDRELYARLMQEQLENVLDPVHGRIHVAASREFKAQMQKYTAFPQRLLHILTSTAMPALDSMPRMSAEMETSITEGQIAIALERHRLAHGSLPENLAALAPVFLPHLPIDPIDGQPLRFRKISDIDYRIWSIGWDEKDGGGVAGKKNTDGDWVLTSLPPPPAPQ